MLSIVRIRRSSLSGATGSVHSMRFQPKVRAQYSAAARLRAIYSRSFSWMSFFSSWPW